ncbi:hypothetical protein Tco_1236842 [Tanacetum coccineum]
MSVRQVWKRKTPPPKSSPTCHNDSPPPPPRNTPHSISPPMNYPQRDRIINQLHTISTLIDSQIPTPPSSPLSLVQPPTHAQVGCHASFCHCCRIDSPFEQRIRRLGKMEEMCSHYHREKGDEMGRVPIVRIDSPFEQWIQRLGKMEEMCSHYHREKGDEMGRDETVYKEWEDRMERAATNASSLEAEQDSGSGPRCQVTILGGAKAQTRFEAASKQSNDPSLSRVNILGSGEDSMKLNELMELYIVSLKTERELVRINIDVRNALCNEIEVNVVTAVRLLTTVRHKLMLLETSIRSDLNLEDAGGTDCLPTDTIFEELARMGHPLLLNHLHLNPRRNSLKGSRKRTLRLPMTEKETNEESMPKHSYDPSQSGEDRMQLLELMNLCTKLSNRVLALETTKTTQALEIASLKSRVKQLEKKANKRTHKFKRLYRVGSTRRVESSNNEGLGAQEDASKHGRSIKDIDKDAKVSLVDETQGRSDDTKMFDTDALIGDEVFAENDMNEKEHDVIPKEVSAAETITTVGIKILVSTATPSTTAASPPVITESTVTIAPSTILKAKGITFREAGETTTRTPTSVSSSSIKDKGKAKMVEPKVPLNKKDQIKQATLAKIEEWDNVQAMVDADYELCKRLQEQEQEEKRRKPLTKGQRRNQMCTYLKNMRGFTHNQLKNKSYEEIQKALDKIMGWINNFKPMDSEEVKSSEKKAEGSRKKSIDEHKEVEEDDEAEMKKHMEIVQDKEEIANDAIPLATKPLMTVEYKIVKEGRTKGILSLDKS